MANFENSLLPTVPSPTIPPPRSPPAAAPTAVLLATPANVGSSCCIPSLKPTAPPNNAPSVTISFPVSFPNCFASCLPSVSRTSFNPFLVSDLSPSFVSCVPAVLNPQNGVSSNAVPRDCPNN